MKTDLSPDQIASYQNDGFLVYENFLDAAEVAELKQAVADSIATLGTNKLVTGDLKDGDSFYDKVFTQKLNLWLISATIKSYMLNPKLGKMLCDLEGVDGFRVWHDQALIKQPFANATGWHLDNPYWSFYSKHSISIWIALEDATYQNGCMYYLPGTHKMSTYDNVNIGMNMDDLFKIYPEYKKIDSVPAPMKAGTCGFHNGLTAHGAGANMTRGTRIAMTCAYMPTGSTFNGNKNILPNDYFKSLTKGDVLQNDDWNPVVYARS
jgi:ectoine hydroxylase-related dioxygenase (phytanoyl-CoA dioxygenase family)